MQKIRTVVQLAFLILFVSLMVLGKAQFWMGFVFLSIILATFFGRFYCGWACPINTLMRPTAWLGRKFGLAKKPVPGVLKGGKPRAVVLFVFLIGLGYTIYTITQGRKFPLPLIVIPFGLLITVLISPNAWHRYLCPWGSLFSLTARFTRLGLHNAPAQCISCGKCENNCPADSVVNKESKNYFFDTKNCLLCFECKSQCPKGAVIMGKTK